MEQRCQQETSALRDCLGCFRREVSGQRAFSVVEKVAGFYRAQASPGYRDAADCCAGILRKQGLKVTIRQYPADPSVTCFTQRLFWEWHCREAQLELISPRQEALCCFTDNDMSIIQRSAPADFRGKPLPIVYVADDADPSDLSLDLTGKLLFVENNFAAWVSAAVRQGAAGLLTVSMPEIPPVREKMSRDPEIMNCCANLSFAPEHGRGAGDLFGFVLTPAQGAELRELCRELAREGRYPEARGFVDSEFCPGTIENVEAWIEGTGEEEILLVAHLCHPKSSVNDNASGVGCAIEALTALQSVIAAGTLPRPKRTIRLLLVPEMTGTYAYLAEHEKELERIRAGLNIDMVAGRQDGRAGPLLVIDTPDCSRSVVGDLARVLLDELRRECALAAKGQYVPLFNSQVKPFMPGSDHVILSDPSIGIPAVALTQWPDKTYHTSGDSLDHIDPGLLARVSALAAAYLYSLAALEERDLPEILAETQKRFFARLMDLQLRHAGAEELRCCREHALAACQSALAFFPPHSETAEREVKAAQSRLASLFPAVPPAPLPGLVPRRRFRGPLSIKSLLPELDEVRLVGYDCLTREYPEGKGLLDYAVYAMDGQRSLEEIALCLQLETGVYAPGYVAALCGFLRQLDLIDYVESETR